VIDEKKLSEVLLREHYVSEEDLKKASSHASENKSSIADYLKEKGIVNNNLLGQAVGESFGVPFTDLSTYQPVASDINKIPELFAKKHKVVFVKESKESAVVATSQPNQTQIEEKLREYFPKKSIIISFAFESDIENLFVLYEKPLNTRFAQIIKSQDRVAPEIVDQIIDDALSLKVSDIHFEPDLEDVRVRFRIDGLLREVGRIGIEDYESILTLVKVKAHLRIDEHLSAQDGSISFQKEDKNADLRVAIIPVLNGEKISIRVLSSYVRDFTLSDLGISKEKQEDLEKEAKKPFGMILVTGPTGSGKTTTLYAVLKSINKPEANIITIEDPVEYRIRGINQIKVNIQTGLTFARGLRSIVRQDPDIILVGEIRDTETAEISINAALTGHLLLSTFHANDAASSIPRLLDMEAEAFLLASTLELIISQRLVRKICLNCRVSYEVSGEELKKSFDQAEKYFKPGSTLYRGKGCPQCNNTGYNGRIGIFEFLHITKEIEDLILKHASSDDIAKQAIKQNDKSMFDDGVEKVVGGFTTIEELVRVAKPRED